MKRSITIAYCQCDCCYKDNLNSNEVTFENTPDLDACHAHICDKCQSDGWCEWHREDFSQDEINRLLNGNEPDDKWLLAQFNDDGLMISAKKIYNK